MSARVTDDYALRQRLAMRRLEEALQCQQREREETTFYLQCMFCRYLARGNRSKIIHHLYMVGHCSSDTVIGSECDAENSRSTT